MKDYIKQLEERNELLSNRLEDVERILHDETAETSLELLIKAYMKSIDIYSPTNAISRDFRMIHFRPGAYIDIELVAHKVAYKLFKNSFFLYDESSLRTFSEKRKEKYLVHGDVIRRHISYSYLLYDKEGIDSADCFFILGNWGINHFYEIETKIFGLLDCPIVFMANFYIDK